MTSPDSTSKIGTILNLLRCPITHSDLSEATPDVLAKVNEKISQKKAFNRIGQLIEAPLEAGLVNKDQTWFLPIRGGIVVMVVDEAIAIQH